MSLFSLLSVVNLLAFGLVFSYTDLKFGKIYNKSVAWGFISGFLILVYFYGNGFDGNYLKRLLINGSIALFFSYFLWFTRKWSAGDAKIFSFFSFFLPLEYYQHNYLKFFPAVNILINAFTIIMLYISFIFLIFFFKGVLINGFTLHRAVVNRNNIRNILRLMLSYVFVSYLISQLSNVSFLSMIFSNRLAVFFIMYLLYSPLSGNKFVSNISCGVSIFILAYLFAFDRSGFYPLLSRVAVYVAVIGAVRYCLDLYMKNKETDEVKVKDLKIGQILVENEAGKIARLAAKVEDCDYNQTRNYGLNSGQIKIIKNLLNLEDVLKVYKTFYLGPVMLAGVAITIIIRGSLIRLILKTFHF
jgi:hypothetical protein